MLKGATHTVKDIDIFKGHFSRDTVLKEWGEGGGGANDLTNTSAKIFQSENITSKYIFPFKMNGQI
jgi:hypothetical protein